MKKISFITIFIMILFLSSCNWCGFYEKSTDINPVIYYNDKSNKAFVAQYLLDEKLENTVINIPEEYKGCTVYRMGGYYGTGVPTPFTIQLDGYYPTCKPDNLDGVIQLEIQINLSKSIVEFETCSLEKYITNEDKTYKLSYYFNCPSDNNVFYSKDGELYYKSDDSLVQIQYNYIPNLEEIEANKYK